MPRSTMAATASPLNRFFSQIGDIALDTTAKLAPDLIARELGLKEEQPIAEQPTFISTILPPNGTLNNVATRATTGDTFGIPNKLLTTVGLIGAGVLGFVVLRKVL